MARAKNVGMQGSPVDIITRKQFGVRAHDADLKKIQQEFQLQAQALTTLYTQLNDKFRCLWVGRTWVGSSADAFFDEFATRILPSLRNLEDTFALATEVTYKIRSELGLADREACGLLKLPGPLPRRPLTLRPATGGVMPAPGSMDEVIWKFLNALLGVDSPNAKEYIEAWLNGKVEIPLRLGDLTLTGGVRFTMTRDENGNFVVNVTGQAAVGVQIGIDQHGVSELEIGVQQGSTVSTTLTFDPSKPGDMTALAAMHAQQGSTLLGAGMLPGLTIGLAGTLTGSNVDWAKNISNIHVGNGIGLAGSGLFVGVGEVSAGAQFSAGTGFEIKNGQVTPYQTISYDVETHGALKSIHGAVQHDLAIGLAAKVYPGPNPVTELTLTLEAKMGVQADMSRALTNFGMPPQLAAAFAESQGLYNNHEGQFEIKVTIHDGLGNAMQVFDPISGTLDFSRIAMDATYMVTLVGKTGNTLETGINVALPIEGDAGIGSGTEWRKPIIHFDQTIANGAVQTIQFLK